MSPLLEMFQSDFLLHHAVYGSAAVGFVCPLVGVYFLLRRLVLWGLTLPQVSAAGISFAFLLQGLGVAAFMGGEGHEKHLAIAGAVTFTAAAIAALSLLDARDKDGAQGRLGALYAAAAAAAILFVSWNAQGEVEMLGLLRGEIVSISEEDFHAMINVFAGVAASLLLFQREFALVSFDRDMAVTLGRRARLWDLLLFSLIGLTISLGVMTAGPLVIFGMLVIPPLAAQPWARGMTSFSLIASLLGGLSALAGFHVSYNRDLPLGPVIVATAFLMLVLSRLAHIATRFGSRS